MTNELQTTARNATAADLVNILNTQKARKLDVVVPAVNIRSQHGVIAVKGSESQLSDDGVTVVDGHYRPTEVFDEGASEKLGIPRQYLAKLRAERPSLYDTNINSWLRGQVRRSASGETEVIHEPDSRAFLLRLFRGDDGGEGVARAMLSDKFGITMDNLDVLTAVMKGIDDAGQHPLVRVTNLTERNMRVRFEFPDRNALAPGLLDNYRSPFGEGGATRAGRFDQLRQQYGAHHIFSETEAPVAFMGFDLGNSETGGGAYTLYPVIEMVRCTNGWVERKRGIRKVHLGSKLTHGEVRPSAATVRKAGELVTSETTDAVRTWLADGYLEQLIAARTEQAQTPIASVTETVPAITQGLGFTADEQKGILDMFVVSGQPTAGGLAQAVSAYAQTVEDPDRAYDIELKAIDALEKAAAR